MSKLLSLLITILFLALGVLLGVLNPTSVPFDLFIYQINLPLSLLLAITLIIGMLAGSLFILGQMLKLQFRLKNIQKQNSRLANELIELKKSNLNPESLQLLQKNNLLLEAQKTKE